MNWLALIDSSVLMDCGCNVVRRLSQLVGAEQRDRVGMKRDFKRRFCIDSCLLSFRMHTSTILPT